MIITTAIATGAIAAVAVVAFAGGFVVSDWRSSGEIERLNSANTLLKASNTQCATDIASVRTSVTNLIGESEAREKAAAIEMDNAQVESVKHSHTAVVIKAAPIRPGEPMCEAIEREQIEYVNWRRVNGN